MVCEAVIIELRLEAQEEYRFAGSRIDAKQAFDHVPLRSCARPTCYCDRLMAVYGGINTAMNPLIDTCARRLTRATLF
ncbi:MAG: hypothetical protein H6637_05305 [Ardenticatenales bacterium]|nr:hypothetical protein [Ardenticatenales bacterium]